MACSRSSSIIIGPTLYGTTENGGTSGAGTVFSVSTNSPYNFATLHYFSSPVGPNTTNSDGAYPFAGLVLSGTNLYGTTYYGGNVGVTEPSMPSAPMLAARPSRTSIASLAALGRRQTRRPASCYPATWLYGPWPQSTAKAMALMPSAPMARALPPSIASAAATMARPRLETWSWAATRCMAPPLAAVPAPAPSSVIPLPAPQLSIRLFAHQCYFELVPPWPPATPCNPRRNSRRRFGTRFCHRKIS